MPWIPNDHIWQSVFTVPISNLVVSVQKFIFVTIPVIIIINSLNTILTGKNTLKSCSSPEQNYQLSTLKSLLVHLVLLCVLC